MNFFIGLIAVIVVLAFIIFPEFRKKLHVLVGGFLNIFVEDAAKTPEGANAVFNQAIEEVQNQYNKAATTLNKLSGELKHAETDIVRINNEIKEVESTCERLVKAGQIAEAEVYASRRAELVSELEQKKECVARLKPMVNDATQIYDACGKKLRDLKRTRKETVDKLRMNGQLKDLLGDLDELKRDTATSKMLDAVNGMITHNCRLRNEVQENTFSYTLGAGGVSTGSKGVITININRLVQDAVKAGKPIQEAVREQVDKVHKYLLAYNEIVKDSLNAGLLGVYNAGYISMEKQYLTIGINGFVEGAEFLGIKIGPNEEYFNYGEMILKPIYEMNRAAKTDEIMFNTEFVPKMCGHLAA